MGIKTRTAIATAIRQREQGFLTDTEAYHAICNAIAEGAKWAASA